ncbi:MAG: hypothetical protein CR217_04945 [Beijerinckiaceae bacterium]|nr:MAG: hypothetical protein CR217_04945 [Beijerinckiaceae bacterium]
MLCFVLEPYENLVPYPALEKMLIVAKALKVRRLGRGRIARARLLDQRAQEPWQALIRSIKVLTARLAGISA